MKNLLSLSLFFVCFIGNTQIVMTADVAEKKFSKDSLQSIYFNELFAGDITQVFDVGTEFFIDEWSRFVNSTGRFLYNKHFQWGKMTRGDLDVYFNKEGKIDLLFISLRDNELTEENKQLLLSLLNEFAKEYKFKITPKIPFSNSGSFQYAD